MKYIELHFPHKNKHGLRLLNEKCRKVPEILSLSITHLQVNHNFIHKILLQIFQWCFPITVKWSHL